MKVDQLFLILTLIFSCLVLTGCPGSKDVLKGAGMARKDLASIIASKLGGKLPSQTLSMSSNTTPRSWSRKCLRTGLQIDPSLRVKGPHLWAPDLVKELFPRGELRSQWCPGESKQPVKGSIYLDEFMYGDNVRCGRATNLPLIKRLNNIVSKGRIYLKGVCHTLIKFLPELGLFLEVDDVELTHPDFPLAKPVKAIFLRTVELHVLPLPEKKKHRVRASLVFDPPNSLIRQIQDGLHEQRAWERAYANRAECRSLLPGRATVVLNFGYFDSPIVKKSKGVGYAEFELQLFSFQSGAWTLKESQKLRVTVSDFSSSPRHDFRITSLGSHQLKAVLDGVTVSEIRFAASIGTGTPKKVEPESPGIPPSAEESGERIGSGAQVCPIVVEPKSAVAADHAIESSQPGVLHMAL